MTIRSPQSFDFGQVLRLLPGWRPYRAHAFGAIALVAVSALRCLLARVIGRVFVERQKNRASCPDGLCRLWPNPSCLDRSRFVFAIPRLPAAVILIWVAALSVLARVFRRACPAGPVFNTPAVCGLGDLFAHLERLA